MRKSILFLIIFQLLFARFPSAVGYNGAVVSSNENATQVGLDILEKGVQWVPNKQKGTGKNFLNSDFKPEHLRLIYNTFNDDIVNHYLQGKLNPKSPNLIRQF